MKLQLVYMETGDGDSFLDNKVVDSDYRSRIQGIMGDDDLAEAVERQLLDGGKPAWSLFWTDEDRPSSLFALVAPRDQMYPREAYFLFWYDWSGDPYHHGLLPDYYGLAADTTMAVLQAEEWTRVLFPVAGRFGDGTTWSDVNIYRDSDDDADDDGELDDADDDGDGNDLGEYEPATEVTVSF